MSGSKNWDKLGMGPLNVNHEKMMINDIPIIAGTPDAALTLKWANPPLDDPPAIHNGWLKITLDCHPTKMFHRETGEISPYLEITQKNPDVLGQAFIFSQLKPPLCHHVSWWNPCFLSVSQLHFRTGRRQLHHLLLCRTSLSSHVVHIDLTNCARSATSGWQKKLG